MTDEQRKEICRAAFYGMSLKEIAEVEEAAEKEVSEAIAWGDQTGYTADLEKRGR